MNKRCVMVVAFLLSLCLVGCGAQPVDQTTGYIAEDSTGSDPSRSDSSLASEPQESAKEDAAPAESSEPESSTESNLFDPQNPYDVDLDFLKEHNIPMYHFYYPGYDFIGWPSEQFVVARKDGKYGYLNEEGFTERIPFEYSLADDFQGGIAAVCRQGDWGVIDTENTTVVPLQYQHIIIIDDIIVAFDIHKNVWNTDVGSISPDFIVYQYSYYNTDGILLYRCPYTLVYDDDDNSLYFTEGVDGSIHFLLAEDSSATKEVNINGLWGQIYDENSDNLIKSTWGPYEDEPVYAVSDAQNLSYRYVSAEELLALA